MSTRLKNRTERLAYIEHLLFRSDIGMRVVEIAGRCEVDRRTIYRDLTLLTHIGVPIHQKEGRFFLDRENYTATIRLNFDEAIALFLATRVAAQHTDHPNPHTSSALSKLGNALPTPVASYVSTMSSAANEHGMDFRYVSVLETLTRAWGDRQKVKLWYINGEGSRPRAREFATYCIEAAASGEVFLIGFDSLLHRVRALKMNRIRRALPIAATYQIPAQFDPRRYLVNGWGFPGGELDDRTLVVVQCSGEAAVAVRRKQWSGPQRIEVEDENTVRLSVPLSDWHDVLPWVRSWGAEVEVIEPPELRDAMAQEVAKLNALYAVSVRM